MAYSEKEYQEEIQLFFSRISDNCAELRKRCIRFGYMDRFGNSYGRNISYEGIVLCGKYHKMEADFAQLQLAYAELICNYDSQGEYSHKKQQLFYELLAYSAHYIHPASTPGNCSSHIFSRDESHTMRLKEFLSYRYYLEYIRNKFVAEWGEDPTTQQLIRYLPRKLKSCEKEEVWVWHFVCAIQNGIVQFNS